jgi:hypothetical protein
MVIPAVCTRGKKCRKATKWNMKIVPLKALQPHSNGRVQSCLTNRVLKDVFKSAAVSRHVSGRAPHVESNGSFLRDVEPFGVTALDAVAYGARLGGVGRVGRQGVFGLGLDRGHLSVTDHTAGWTGQHCTEARKLEHAHNKSG